MTEAIGAKISSITRNAIKEAARRGLGYLRSDPPMRLVEWSRKHFRLPPESSHAQGEWNPWGYQVGIMDAFDDHRIEQVDVAKAKRTGYTKMVTAKVAHSVAHRRRKVGMWQPTDDDRDSYVKSEIDPAFAEMPAIKAASAATRANQDTIKLKRFRGAALHLQGAKAARAFRRLTLDDAILDEVDGMDRQVEKSSDPVTLARGRLEGAPAPKLILGTTPRRKGFSHVEREAGNADARMRYRIACPKCGVEHPLIWNWNESAAGMKWDNADPRTVRHVCPHCLESIVQADYLAIESQGAWVCEMTGVRYSTVERVWKGLDGKEVFPPRHVAFVGVWTAYSPQRDWWDIVREGMEAKAAASAGDDGPLQGFVNETLAETYEEAHESTESSTLQERANMEALPRGIVPSWAGYIAIGVDVQKDRWEAGVWAFGPDDESCCIDYLVIYGDTSDDAQWDEKLTPLVGAKYPTESGQMLAADSMGVDTGYQTHLAYKFARIHQSRNVYATKGDSAPGRPIKSKARMQDIKQNGKVIRRNGVRLWFIGTDTAKDLLHGRLQLTGRGPGRVHFAAGLPDEFFRGITAERRVQVRTKQGIEFRWECPDGARNEPLDTKVICMLLSELAGLSAWDERRWKRYTVTSENAKPAIRRPTAEDPRPASKPPPPVKSIAKSDWSSRL